jgi:hypothetical protein
VHGSEADAPYFHLIPGGGGSLSLLDHLRIARQINLHSEGRGPGEIHTNPQATKGEGNGRWGNGGGNNLHAKEGHISGRAMTSTREITSPPMAVCNGSAWSVAALAEAGNAIQQHSHSSGSNLPPHQKSQHSTASPHASSLPAAVSHALAPTSNPHGAQQSGIHMIPFPTQTSCYVEAQVNAFIPQRDVTRGQVSFSEDRDLGAQNTSIIMHDHFRVQEKTGSSPSATYTYTYTYTYNNAAASFPPTLVPLF